MDRRERVESFTETVQAALDGRQSEIWTAIPGVILGFDSVALTAVVHPSIQAQARSQAGDWIDVQMPVLLDVPIVFPGGGNWLMTFPLTEGDEVLLVFAARCIDSWFDQGAGSSPYPGAVQSDQRQHSLSDAFAIPCVRSKPRGLDVPMSTLSCTLRSVDGTQLIELANGGVINIKAPGGLNIIGDVAITGVINSTGVGTFAGHSADTHTHGGVTTGSGVTGTPIG